ncbi:thermostable hemolysin [Acinetobacter sp. ANC 4178]|uniref:thermostable hemolysin n=1 Tax=Acinetobacter sp. ANC 4178 TaxID=2529839 RepID=UPI00103F37D3|nr:thermostable hemolysin [Acinetobacter sp. ANC 4178]TCB68522.1 hypothetical protein E0H87_00815 [Acinetobacter sp. ANC 4178]
MTTFIFEKNFSTKFNGLNYYKNHLIYKNATVKLEHLNVLDHQQTYQVVSHQKNMLLRIHAAQIDQPERKQVETYISTKYQEMHKATLSHFSSTLFVGEFKHETQVAIGIEPLKSHQVFLEQYLVQPIEQTLKKLVQRDVAREKIIEIGNLASQNMEYAKMMVAFLVFYLTLAEVEWAVCTGTIAVRYVLQQMGLHFHVLEKANPEVLGNAQKQWGNYYQQKPLVLAINVADALTVTQQHYDFKVNHAAISG